MDITQTPEVSKEFETCYKLNIWMMLFATRVN